MDINFRCLIFYY